MMREPSEQAILCPTTGFAKQMCKPNKRETVYVSVRCITKLKM